MTAEPGATRKVDLLVRNAYVVTMDPERRVYPGGAVAIDGGAIVSVGPERDVAAGLDTARTIDAHGAVVHPGFVDTHIHVSYHNFRWAIPEGVDYWEEYLGFHADYWEQVEDEEEHVGTLLASLEMARNGTTCFLEAGSTMAPDAGAAAIEKIGIRGVIADPHLMDVFGGRVVNRYPDEPRRAFRVMGTELKRNSDPDALVRGHICLRGLATASDELQLAAKELADEHGVVLSQHQSWDRPDVAADDRLRGRHPLLHFAEIGVLGQNCTFVHMNFLRDDEIAPIVESRMSISWNPNASMILGIGATFRGRHSELRKQGANVALGSDSPNSTGCYDIGDQAFLAMLTAREKTEEADALSAQDVLAMATIDGARAVGLADRLGSLEVGKRADLVVRHEHLPEAHPGLDPIRSVVLSSRSKSVGTVIVNGEVVVEKGHSTRVDEEEVYARSREASRRLLKRMGRA